MNGNLQLSYLVPVHNEEETIPGTTRLLVERLRSIPGSEILLIENGSSDGSPALVDDLGCTLSEPEVAVIAAHAPKGFGHAIRRGIDLASGNLLVITAADLPFAFSDLEQVLEMDPRPALVIGSKAHVESKVSTSTKRRLMSLVFRLARRLVIGLSIGDSQGSIFIDGDLARRARPYLESDDFFLSTELVAFAIRLGAKPVEIPVDYLRPRSGSTVRPLRDGFSMALALFDLRRRLTAAGTPSHEARAT